MSHWVANNSNYMIIYDKCDINCIIIVNTWINNDFYWIIYRLTMRRLIMDIKMNSKWSAVLPWTNLGSKQ